MCIILFVLPHNYFIAEVVESVDTRDLKSLAFGRAGSIPALGTLNIQLYWIFLFAGLAENTLSYIIISVTARSSVGRAAGS